MRTRRPQLCINYANERLHNFFLQRVFEVEIELYRVQNLPVDASEIVSPDNSKVIELLEKASSGIFPLLDAQCKMPKGSDKNFNLAICTQHAKHPHFASLSSAKGVKVKAGTAADEVFVIRHFAGDVVYSSTTFLEKNTDALSPVFKEMLKQSSVPVVVQVAGGTPPAPPGDGGAPRESSRGRRKSATGGSTPRLTRRPSAARVGDVSSRLPAKKPAPKAGGANAKAASVSKTFLLGLKRLMNEIATTHPFFVRCIKPNQTLVPHDFMVSMVLAQMERSGTIECVKLMQAGFPSRAPYAELQTRFKSALPDFMLEVRAAPARLACSLTPVYNATLPTPTPHIPKPSAVVACVPRASRLPMS